MWGKSSSKNDSYIRNYKFRIMKFLTAFSLAALPLFGIAQSISPEVIASAGEHFDNGTVQLSWTLGEVMVDTYDNGTNILTQGFHQTDLTVTSIEETLADIRMNLYPNPTSEYLNIELGNNEQNINLQLYDMNGKLIHKDVINAYDTKYVLPMHSVATGKYLIQMQSEDGKMNTTHQVVKVGIAR
ncbi:MAG: hypothetical protein RL266_2026 [Bacteroidota bacterium]